MNYVLLTGFLSMLGFNVNAEVLELGASELHGKKDQPEAMTFISRAPIDKANTPVSFEPKELIKKEIDKEIFLFSGER